jgi:hypothetical protein
MKPEEKAIRFFLGANTPQGFVSRFDHFSDKTDGFRVLIIKGGPGSGKSTIIKKIVEKYGDEKTELIHCSSDVDSLDGAICPARRFAVCDGTAPHTVEPKYPGALESIVDVSACWDEGALFACRGDIIPLTKSISLCHEQSCRFLSAASSLLGDTYRLALGALNTPKLSSYLSRLTEREFKARGKGGSEKVRFLSAVTNKGVVSFLETARLMCDKIYIVNDDYGAVSRLLLSAARSAALSAGYDVISCYCPLSPYEKLEHLFIPKLSLGFLTSNRFHDFGDVADAYRIVNCQRFSDVLKLKEFKRRVSFNRKAAQQMVDKASELLAEAKKMHDELESYYTGATDYDKLDALTKTVMDKIAQF